MPKISLSQTNAFKLCEDGTCDEPKEKTGERLECKKTDKCKDKGCYCQLFQRGKKAGADDPWDVTPIDGTDETTKKPDLDYKCICVRPILPEGYTLCDKPLCRLSEVDDPSTKPKTATVECSGKCDDPCECNLFRLHVKPKDADKKAAAKWDFVAKPGEKVDRKKDYYYRCFCSKKA